MKSLLSFQFQDNTVTNRSTPSSSSSSSQKASQRPTDMHTSHIHQFQHIRHRFEKMTSNTPSKQNVRRYTSENNLNEITSSSKSIVTHQNRYPLPVQTTATSPEDLSTIPGWKNLSPQARLSVLLDSTNHLTSNGISASLIDLTALDKLSTNNQAISVRPHFRFVPSSNNHKTSLKEEPEIEQQTQSTYDHYHLKTIPSNRISINNNQNKFNHNIVKPTVIIPPMPQSAPITRLKETNIHHQNGNSAFKPHLSNKHNEILSQVQQVQPVSHIKRTDSVHKPYVHVGITNPNHSPSNHGLLHRQHQKTIPQFHQSLLNLSSIGTSDALNTNQVSDGMHETRASMQATSSNFIKYSAYSPQSNKINRHHQYHQPPPPPSSAPLSSRVPQGSLDNPISRWIQQINNSSSINGLIYPSQQQPFTNGGGGNRPQQQIYPYGSYISINSGKINKPKESLKISQI